VRSAMPDKIKESSENYLIWSRRRFVISCVTVLTGPAYAKPRKHRPVQILFICQFGTAKSAIAREILKRKAQERGITIGTFSRGITLADHVSPELRQKLAADGINPNADKAAVLAPLDWRKADIVIAFNPFPADVNHSDIRDWSDLPSLNDDYAHARDILDRRLDALLNELAKRDN
jgi:protein-tyrosine-phosphatase